MKALVEKYRNSNLLNGDTRYLAQPHSAWYTRLHTCLRLHVSLEDVYLQDKEFSHEPASTRKNSKGFL